MDTRMWREDVLGWRGRVGVIVPSPNLLVETSMPRLAPEGITFHTARLTLSRGANVEGVREMSARILDAARDLATAKVDAIAYCCTAGSFVEGPAHDAAVIRKIHEVAGCPVVTTMGAIVGALRRLGITRPVALSPYIEELEKLEVRYLEQEGFEIVATASMGISDPVALHYPSPREVYRLARQTWTDRGDGVLISCIALRSHIIAEVLERDLGTPVVTALTATLWAILAALGVREPVRGYGRLLETP
jgi:maleate isomerase